MCLFSSEGLSNQYQVTICPLMMKLNLDHDIHVSTTLVEYLIRHWPSITFNNKHIWTNKILTILSWPTWRNNIAINQGLKLCPLNLITFIISHTSMYIWTVSWPFQKVYVSCTFLTFDFQLYKMFPYQWRNHFEGFGGNGKESVVAYSK